MLTTNKEAIFSSFVSIIAVLLLSKEDPIPGRDKLRGRLATQIFIFFSSQCVKTLLQKEHCILTFRNKTAPIFEIIVIIDIWVEVE